METPYPVYLKFYVFHVVNPKAIENGEKPILEEMGPYVYRSISLLFTSQYFASDEYRNQENKLITILLEFYVYLLYI
jgi:hypothetical protein